MLDQNTDRMWYVIGAVLIGAAIIFASSVMFPNAFASVSDNVLSTIDVAKDRVAVINKPRKNYLMDSNEMKSSSGFVDYYPDMSQFNDLVGQTVTISFDAMDPYDSHHKIDVYFSAHNTDLSGESRQTFGMSDPMTIDGEWKRYTHTIVIPDFDVVSHLMVSLRIRGNHVVPGALATDPIPNVGTFQTKRVKIELGSNDTDYIEHEND